MQRACMADVNVTLGRPKEQCGTRVAETEVLYHWDNGCQVVLTKNDKISFDVHVLERKGEKEYRSRMLR